MIARANISISRSALRNNYRILSKKVPHLDLLPMVKADAYGHGAFYAAQSLLQEKKLYGFGVASFKEAVELRLALKNSKVPILVFSDCAPWTQEHFGLCKRYHLEPVLSEIESLLHFQSGRESTQISFHVEVNTGMNRLGVPVQSLPLLKNQPRSIFTHLADADSPNSSLTQKQMSAFQDVVEYVRWRFPETLLHFSKSSAIWNHRDFPMMKEMNLARPGLSLYGVRPFESAKEDGLKRVMSFSSRVLNRIYLQKGDQVGYGGTYRCKNAKGEWVAILGAGYADGVFRSLSNQGIAYHKKKKLNFLGRVSMDLSAVQGHAKLMVGDEIFLWGDQVDPYEQALLAGTIPYEIMTRIGHRVERTYE